MKNKKDVVVRFRASQKFLKKLKDLADKKGVTLSTFIRNLIEPNED